MIIVLKDNPDQKQLENLVSWLKSMGLDIHMSKGQSATIMGLIGDTAAVDIDLINALDIVETVKRVQEPYKNVNRKFHPEDTVVEVLPGVKIGGGNFQVIAGPCSVESEEQICLVAEEVKNAGAGMLRGGAFKPRTSPYAFQGMRAQGIDLLLEAKEKTGLPIVTEVMDISQLPLFENVDVIQIGARNMQNFELLKEVGDKQLLRLVRLYAMFPVKILTRYIAMQLHRSKHKKVAQVLLQQVRQAAKAYPERKFSGKEEKQFREQRKRAQDYAKEWEEKGYRTDIFREEPFVASRDSIEGKYYVMIWKKGFRNQKAKIEEIL